MPEYHAEPYIYLPAVSHKSALIAWGAFYFRTNSRGRWKIVDDSDLHSGWERRVLPLWRVKEPAIDFFLGKRVALPLFFERGIIEIRPRRAFLWEDGRTDAPPQIFELEGAAR